MFNASSPMMTALLRGFWSAVVSFGGTSLVTYQATDNWPDALVAGGVAAFIAFGFRGGAEGISDARRDQRGAVVSGDVGARIR